MATPVPPLTVGDVIELTMEQTLYEQTCLLVRHYEVASTNSMLSFIDECNELIDWCKTPDGLGTKMLTAQCQDVQCQRITAQVVFPGRTVRVSQNWQTQGALAVDCMPSNMAAVITLRTDKATVRGAHAGLGQVGGVHLCGIPRDQVDGDRLLEATWFDDFANIGQTLIGAIALPGGTVLDPVILHRPGSLPRTDYIHTAVPKRDIRVMRRRTLRVGV